MAAGRTWHAALTMWLVVAVGCGSAAAPTETAVPCQVTPRDGPERVMLLSEARAAHDAGQRVDAEFVLAVSGTRSVELQLTSVGCNCYQVQREGQTLTVGDRCTVPAGGTTQLQIVSQPSVEPGLRDYHAEFSGQETDGSPFTVSLAHEVRTLADIAVRPDSVQIELKPESQDSGHSVPVLIEQHVRTTAPLDIAATWDELPVGLAATEPVQVAPPQEISAGVWRVRWQSNLTVRTQGDGVPESPRALSVVSRLGEREIARSNCMLVARRRSGVSAPPLVHFGRLSAAKTSARRIQIRALDDVRFKIKSIAARDGDAEAVFASNTSQTEHWIEVRATVTEGTLDDLLTVATDHPSGPTLQIAVKGIGPRLPSQQ